MIGVADLLAAGYPLPELEIAVTDVPPGTRCVISGQPITRGVPVSAITTDSTTEFLDHFRNGLNGYISEAAARCYKSANPRKGNILARSLAAIEGEPGLLPLIARDRARAEGRPCWSELVRDLWPRCRGKRAVLVLSTDTKKRLWPRARVGTIGSRTALYYYDAETAGNGTLWLDWPRLLICLDLVEEVYTAGYPKAAIRESLYTAGRITQSLGIGSVRQWERTIAPWRGSPEFVVATLIAQRREEPANG
jgi:hypothetical protein